MPQSKTLLNLSASLPPQEAFINEGSFVAHRGLSEYFQYEYLVRESTTKNIPLNNNFPLIIRTYAWSTDSLGTALKVSVDNILYDLFDTTDPKGLVTPKEFIISANSFIVIQNKSTSDDMHVVIQAERVSLTSFTKITI